MPQLLIRNVAAETIENLKANARLHGRSMEAEARSLVETNPLPSMEECIAQADEIRERLKGRTMDSCVDILREFRAGR